MNAHACRALLGAELKSNERLKINQTRLADREVLAEEEGTSGGEEPPHVTKPTTSEDSTHQDDGDGVQESTIRAASNHDFSLIVMLSLFPSLD